MSQRIPSRKWKDNSENGRKYLQVTYLIRDLCVEYIKNLCNSIIKIQANLKIHKRYFSTEDIQMANKHMKRLFINIISYEGNVNKRATSYPLRCLYPKKQIGWWGCGETGTSDMAGRNLQWCSHVGKQSDHSSEG